MGAYPSQEPLLQFFAYKHLPPNLQAISKPFCRLANAIIHGEAIADGVPGEAFGPPLPRNPERTVALRKLLEAKDCAVRAVLFKEE